MFGQENYQVAQGGAIVIDATLRDSSGNAITTYTGVEALSAVVWPGGTFAALFSPTITWNTPSAGTITIVISAAATTGLDPGRYQLLARITPPGSDPLDAYGCTIEVLAEAGTGTPLVSYCAFQDLLDRAPWVEKLQKNTDLAGFARQRYLARRWFEDLLHRHYRGCSGLLTDFYFVPGVSFGGRFGQAVYYRDGRRSADLQGWLDANRLDVTDQVVEANAYYALAQICERQVMPGKDDNGYAALAAKYYARALDTAVNITAELDVNGDGVNDTVVRLGITDTLEG